MAEKGIGSLLVTLGLDTRSMDKALGRAMGKFRAYGRNMKRLGATMSASVTAPLAAIGASSFNVASQFGLAMAKVQAVSGATADEFQRLEANAKMLGRTTIFTATDVANLQLEFSKLGFTASEIENVTAATLALAQATDSDLAQAAEVAGSTLRGFGLDTSQTTHVTDVMAAAFSSTALDMASFQDSMKYVAPVAAAAGISIEETTAMLGQMANAGIKGSQAGTSLRMIFQKMATDGGSVSERMSELAATGLTLDSAFDEVGRQAQTALLVLGENKTGVDQLAQSFRDADGAAAGMAAIMDNTSAGTMARMKSAIEGAQIAIGEALAPQMEMMANVVARVAESFANLSPETQRMVTIAAGIAAAIGPLLVILPSIAGAFSVIAGVMTGPVIAAIAGIVAAVVLIREHWDELTAYFTTGDGAAMLDSLRQMFIAAVDHIINVWNFMVDILAGLWSWFGDDIVWALTRSLGWITDIVKIAFDTIQNVFGIFASMFKQDWEGMWGHLKNVLIGAAKLIIKGAQFLITSLLSVVDKGLRLMGRESNLVEGFDSIIDEAMAYLDSLETKFEDTGSTAQSFFASMANGFGSFSLGGGSAKPQVPETPQGETQTMAVNVEPVFAEIEDTKFDEVFADEEQFLQNWAATVQETKEANERFNQSVQQLAGNLQSQFGNLFRGLINGTQSFGDFMKQMIVDLLVQLASLAAAFAVISLLLPGSEIAKGGIGAFMKGSFAIPKFADGGIVSGPVAGLVGEYAGARSNPEVIAPLSKLQSLMGGMNQNVVVTGRISGNDILISNERAGTDRRRVRGF